MRWIVVACATESASLRDCLVVVHTAVLSQARAHERERNRCAPRCVQAESRRLVTRRATQYLAAR